MKKLFLFLLIILCGRSHAQNSYDIRHVTATEVLELSKSSDKPYTWVIVFLPKCKNGAVNFDRYEHIWEKNKDKIQMVVLSIVVSKDNKDSIIKFNSIHNLRGPVYVMDSSYHRDNIMQTHFRFMDDMNGLLGSEKDFFEHLILDNKGHLVHKSEYLDFDEKSVRKYIK